MRDFLWKERWDGECFKDGRKRVVGREGKWRNDGIG